MCSWKIILQSVNITFVVLSCVRFYVLAKQLHDSEFTHEDKGKFISELLWECFFTFLLTSSTIGSMVKPLIISLGFFALNLFKEFWMILTTYEQMKVSFNGEWYTDLRLWCQMFYIRKLFGFPNNQILTYFYQKQCSCFHRLQQSF